MAERPPLAGRRSSRCWPPAPAAWAPTSGPCCRRCARPAPTSGCAARRRPRSCSASPPAVRGSPRSASPPGWRRWPTPGRCCSCAAPSPAPTSCTPTACAPVWSRRDRAAAAGGRARRWCSPCTTPSRRAAAGCAAAMQALERVTVRGADLVLAVSSDLAANARRAGAPRRPRGAGAGAAAAARPARPGRGPGRARRRRRPAAGGRGGPAAPAEGLRRPARRRRPVGARRD